MKIKLIKAIKLHRKLRINQEIYCNRVLKFQFQMESDEYKDALNGLISHNKAVEKIKLPDLYFFLSDLFGFGNILRKAIKEDKLK